MAKCADDEKKEKMKPKASTKAAFKNQISKLYMSASKTKKFK